MPKILNAASPVDPGKQNRLIVEDDQWAAIRPLVKELLHRQGVEVDGAALESATLELIISEVGALFARIAAQLLQDDLNARVAALSADAEAQLAVQVETIQRVFSAR